MARKSYKLELSPSCGRLIRRRGDPLDRRQRGDLLPSRQEFDGLKTNQIKRLKELGSSLITSSGEADCGDEVQASRL